MSKNYKLNYNQYKHLIDVFTTGDFLNESLDKPIGLITYRNLMTKDNILYFTQNTKRTCKIPLGIKKSDSSLKFIDFMERTFDYRHSNKEILLNLARSIICSLLQNYRPDEYKVYHDLDIIDLESLNNFHKVSSPNEVDSIYTSASIERHKTYMKADVFNYKDYRKVSDSKLIIFILTNTDNIRRLRNISCNNLRYGIAYINLECSEIANSSTVSLDNTIRPNIDENIMKEEIKIHKEMLGEYISMKNLKNIITGVILQKEYGCNQVLFNLPISDEILILEFHDDYHYRLKSIDGKITYDKRSVEPLRLCRCLGEDVCKYVMTGAVYSLLSTSNKVRENLKDEYDLTDFDKAVLAEYISKDYNESFNYDNKFKIDITSEEYSEHIVSDTVFYDTPFCKLELKDKQLIITVNGKEKCLPQGLLAFNNSKDSTLNRDLLEIILRYEMYLEYGIHVPYTMYSDFYAEDIV